MLKASFHITPVAAGEISLPLSLRQVGRSTIESRGTLIP
jgi:hypothetical protein